MILKLNEENETMKEQCCEYAAVFKCLGCVPGESLEAVVEDLKKAKEFAEAEVENLKKELEKARVNIVNMLPEKNETGYTSLPNTDLALPPFLRDPLVAGGYCVEETKNEQ